MQSVDDTHSKVTPCKKTRGGGTYRVHPSIFTKAYIVTNAEEKAGIPVNQDQNQHYHLKYSGTIYLHSKHVKDGRSVNGNLCCNNGFSEIIKGETLPVIF